MRNQQKIYIQNNSSSVRNSDIFNVNMSSDFCVFNEPRFNISGATKIIDDAYLCDVSGITYNDIILSSMTECFLDYGGQDCFESLSWNLEINEDTTLAYSANVSTSTTSANTITQEQVNNEIISGFNTLGYTYSNTGTTFNIQKPYGVETLSVILCLDINIGDSCTISDGCPSGYTLTPSSDACVYSAVTAATYLGSGSTIVDGDTAVSYNQGGARFYENITNKDFPIVRTSSTTPIYDNNLDEIQYSSTIQSIFWGNGSGGNGRLNNIGIKGSPDTEWNGLSQCYEFDNPGTYYIGLAADNFCRLYINGDLVINFDDYPLINFYFWHVFPYNFTSGKNIIEMEGKNDGASFSFGFELYSASTIEQLTGATSSVEAGSFWDTSMVIGNTFDLGESVGYTCPSGYSLDLCGVSPTCTQIIYTDLNRVPYSGNCDSLCAILCDNTFNTINSGDTGVYIINTGDTIDLTFQFTANTESFIDNNSSFKYDIFKYNTVNNVFSNNPVYSSDKIEYQTFSGTSAFTESIPISELSLDGDYLIKGYYIFDYCTEFFNMLGVENNTLNKNGDMYGLYKKSIDFYFTAFNSASTPTFEFISESNGTLSQLNGFSLFPTFSGQTDFLLTQGFIGSPIIALNGLTLANEYDYIINSSANTLTISGGTVITDVITVIYNSDGENLHGLTNDLIQITTPIISGITDNQGVNTVYYNTSESKYEVYTTVTPNDGDNIIITLNGLTLSPNIDYYQSISNSNRIILNGNLLIGDVINIYYNSKTQYIGSIYTNSPTINWSIDVAPTNNSGEFTIQVSDISDYTFSSIIFSASTPYIANTTTYSKQIILSGDIGTKYIYRIKNEKIYTTINGDKISSVSYSEIIPIEIQSNSINSY